MKRLLIVIDYNNKTFNTYKVESGAVWGRILTLEDCPEDRQWVTLLTLSLPISDLLNADTYFVFTIGVI